MKFEYLFRADLVPGSLYWCFIYFALAVTSFTLNQHSLVWICTSSLLCRKCVFQRRWVRFDGESLAYYNNDKVSAWKTHAHTSPPSSLLLLTHPHPPHAPWWRQSHPSLTEIYTAGSRAKFWVFPFSIASSSFSLSSSSSLAWQGKKWGQGQSDSTPRMTGQHSLCPPSHTVKYIDVGAWPGPGERKKERMKERMRERERLSSLSASLSSSPSLYLSSFSFCVTVEFEIPLNTACLIIRRSGGRMWGLWCGESAWVEESESGELSGKDWGEMAV